MSIIPLELPYAAHLPQTLKDVLNSIAGITEIDTKALYRIMLSGKEAAKKEGLEIDYDDLVYPIEWVSESLAGSIPRVRARSARTGQIDLVPSILLEKLSPLEALGEQAE